MGIIIKQSAIPHTHMLNIINGFKTLKILVAEAEPRNVATDRTVKIHEIVETFSGQK